MRWILLAILLAPAVRAEQAPPNMEKYYCLYRVGSLEEARKLAEGDPMVQARRLEVEVLAWWVEKGAVTFRPPPAPAGK